MASNVLLTEIRGLALFFLRKDVYCVSLLIHWKLGTSSDISKRDGSGLYYNVYNMHGTSAPFSSEEGVVCVSYIYSVGVGVSSYFCSCIITGLLIPQFSKNVKGVMTPAPISFRIDNQLTIELGPSKGKTETYKTEYNEHQEKKGKYI